MKVVLITGASRGIGRELALAFGRAGYAVGVNYVENQAAAETVVEEIKKAGNKEAEAIPCDVRDSIKVRQMIDTLIKRWQTLDVLVNNAGINRDRTILKMTNGEWNDVIDVNLSGAFWCLREAARVMSTQKSGAIINIASIMAQRGGIGNANYAAAKAGLIGLTRGAAKELGRFQIRVNAVLPGFHETDMAANLTAEQKEKVRSEHLLGHTTQMGDLARMVLEIAQNTSVSGQVFNVDSRGERMSDVVITGFGGCTNFAENAAQLWDHVSGPGPKNERSAPLGQAPKHYRGNILEYAQAAAEEALRQSGLWDGENVLCDTTRVGCTVSVSKPILSPNLAVPEAVSEHLCNRFNIQGETRNVIAACATGAYSVALAASWIEQGLCDVVLAGSAEPQAHPLYEAGFRKMGVMSSEPAMRPFARNRSGFVLGEGAGVVVLESRAHARQRQAPIQATLTGWGWGSDTHSPVAFNSNGALIAQVIRRALERAALKPEQIQHVNAHGTATQSNDWIETQALIKAFGPHAANLMISATKSSTGHLLGAAGSIELVLTVQSLLKQYIPPTAHLEEPDAECPLNYTPQKGHPASFDHALSLSFGFGGPIGALVVSASH